jgi:hypothetical protein
MLCSVFIVSCSCCVQCLDHLRVLSLGKTDCDVAFDERRLSSPSLQDSVFVVVAVFDDHATACARGRSPRDKPAKMKLGQIKPADSVARCRFVSSFLPRHFGRADALQCQAQSDAFVYDASKFLGKRDARVLRGERR